MNDIEAKAKLKAFTALLVKQAEPISTVQAEELYVLQQATKNSHQSKEFIKHDTGKRRLSLIEPLFIQTLGDVITFGAEKYAPNNWRLCEDISRYRDALLRHIFAYLSGELTDPETGIEHLAHAACNLMFLQYFDNIKETTCQ